MNCQLVEDVLQESLDRSLTPGERERLDAHLASCAACRRAWDEHRLLARAAARWARPSLRDEPGDAFTAQVLAQIAARPVPRFAQPSLWLPLAATAVLLAVLALLPGLLWPDLNGVGASARQTPGWLLSNLYAVPGDLGAVWGAVTTGIHLPGWTWAALLGMGAVNAMFCIQARQSYARRSLR